MTQPIIGQSGLRGVLGVTSQDGARSSFESSWFRLEGSGGADSATRDHGLARIPDLVSIQYASSASGSNPQDATGIVTVTKTNHDITVENTSSDELWFRIRAR